VICLRTHSRLALKIRGVAQSYDERMAQHLLGNGRGREGEVASIGNTAHTAGSGHQDIVGLLKSLMIEHSLPLWSGEGWDPAAGGFVERLDIEGRADRAEPRRVRVQARQIYSFAKAAQMAGIRKAAKSQ